jgi:DNA uptake protein ComE-like DNA-binding protein
MAAAKMLKKDLELLVAQLQAELAEVKAQRDEALARLEKAKGCFRAQREEIVALKEQAAGLQQAAEAAAFSGARARSAGRAAAANAGQPVITRFFRGGQLWVKTRAGNKATERLATPEELEEVHQNAA